METPATIRSHSFILSVLTGAPWNPLRTVQTRTESFDVAEVHTTRFWIGHGYLSRGWKMHILDAHRNTRDVVCVDLLGNYIYTLRCEDRML